ncbi:MAG: tRNA 2-selenouridine(34) synthase MnmH [Ginsengibacter sp.]
MPIEKIDVERFLELSQSFPVLDVRSPAEYMHAHIPGAFPVPIFTDEQRKIIGTAYTRQSRQIAVDHGLNYFSERMKIIPGEVEKIYIDKKQKDDAGKTFLVHCWRGGMRSEAVAWLLNLYGYKIYLLRGGYKSFRRWVLAQFEKPYQLNILGGFTGSGKTEVLKELAANGEKVIDLEAMAQHKGSAFGSLGEVLQPGAEMFENLLAVQLWNISLKDDKPGPIWLEDESAHIGTVGIPKPFWLQMRQSQLFFLDIPFEKRLDYIVKTYGVFESESLIECVLKIRKRLGGLETKNVLQFIEQGNVRDAFSILLKYYDKMYAQSLLNRDNLDSLIHKISLPNVAKNNALLLPEQ